MKIIRKILPLFLITLLLCSCQQNREVTVEECKNQNKVLKTTNVLNLRTGKYQDKKECK